MIVPKNGMVATVLQRAGVQNNGKISFGQFFCALSDAQSFGQNARRRRWRFNRCA
jgi:hypothetical protein